MTTSSAPPTPPCALPPLDVLRHVFGDYNQLRPDRVAIPVTRAAAEDFLRLAQRLEIERSLTPAPPTKTEIAHFLMRLVFCLFADSVEILPDRTFRRLIEHNRASPKAFNSILPGLFRAMSSQGSTFGPVVMPYFNGGLFDDDRTIPLDYADLGILKAAAHHDWSHVEPAIFGTLFERSLDAAKRSMIGAHYTSPEDILLLIEPVVIAPLRRRWEAARQSVLEALAQEPPLNRDGRLAAALRANRPALILLQNWVAELSKVRILDPACGSGNFLYLALKRLLDLWQEARTFGFDHGLALALEPIPSPTQLFGIEVDFYAHEIASVVVWIGFLQWKHDHGIEELKSPVLEKLTNIEYDNAIIRENADDNPYEPTWPVAEYIVGNPPWLGGKKLRRALGDKKTDELFALYRGRVGAEADLVTYWFEKARAAILAGGAQSVGLLATQSIRQGANRKVLERVAADSSIFMAWSDRAWVLEGAQVRSSIVAFDNGSEQTRTLNGEVVDAIHANLQTGVQVASARRLPENEGLAFQGPVKVGKFELSEKLTQDLLKQRNPNGKKNSDVVKPWINGGDIVDRPRHRGIIDFGEMAEHEAALYEGPFEHLVNAVKTKRLTNRDSQRKRNWWRLGRSGSHLKAALKPLKRALVTSRVSKHRFFIWCSQDTVPDTRVVVLANDTDSFAGTLHSKIHLTWFEATSSRHGVGNDPTYNTKTCFDTFPFPWPPGTEPSEAESPIVRAIAEAARTLVTLRDAWLNPPGTPEAELKKRTLTNLYNARPTWLANAHRTLDEAVFAAYGWPATLTTQEILARLLALNHQRAATKPPPTKSTRTRRKPKSSPTPSPGAQPS